MELFFLFFIYQNKLAEPKYLPGKLQIFWMPVQWFLGHTSSTSADIRWKDFLLYQNQNLQD